MLSAEELNPATRLKNRKSDATEEEKKEERRKAEEEREKTKAQADDSVVMWRTGAYAASSLDSV